MSQIKNLVGTFFRDKTNKQLSQNVVMMLFIKGMAMVISVLIVPAYVTYFSNDTVYGSWLTVSSVFTWFNMFDFGIGNGLRNYLTKSLAEGDNKASKKYISSAYVSIGMISAVLAVVGAVVIWLLDWNSVLKIPPEVVSANVLVSYIQIVYIGVIIHFFFLLISSVCYAIQKTFLPGLVALITQAMLLVYLYVPNSGNLEQKVLSLSWMHLVSYNLPLLVITLLLFLTKLKEVRPSFMLFDRHASRQIMSLGGGFFLIQLAIIALGSSDAVYINSFFNPDDCVQYNYYHKLFYVLVSLVSLVMQPIWSAVTKAYHENNYGWLKKIWRLICGFSALSIFGCILLGAIYQPVADIWLGKGTLNVEFTSVLLFVIWAAETVIMTASTCIANGFGDLKCQMVFTVLGAIIKLPICFVVSKYNGNWLSVIIATDIAMLPIVIAQPIAIERKISLLVKQQKMENLCKSDF